MDREQPYRIHHVSLMLSNIYIIEFEHTALLVDTGIPGEANRILGKLVALGIHDLSWIFLTHAHYDHVGSAAEVKKATGANVLIQEQDTEPLEQAKTLLGDVRGRGRLTAWMLPMVERLLPVEPVTPDFSFQDRFEIPDLAVPVEVIHTPGHTCGSAGLLLDDRYLFAGDLVSTNGVPHPQRYYAQDWAALERSLRQIKQLRPRLTYPGHGNKALELEDLLNLTS